MNRIIKICDICKKEESDNIITMKIPVIFHVNQHGLKCKPYIRMRELDFCHECAIKTTNVHGNAQWDDTYELRSEK